MAINPQELSQETEMQTTFPNKYRYPEFMGFEGERLLKKIIHKILPLALDRVWAVFTDPQAPGNDCFLSIASASEIMERVEKTTRMHVHALEARRLLVLRLEKKLLLQQNGLYRIKPVVVKDFDGLYALAHDYWLWTRSEEYIEPKREFAELLQNLDDKDLTKRLLRFENYRRIIQDQLPGRKPKKLEVHPLFADYHPAPPFEQEDAEDANGENNCEIGKVIKPLIVPNNAQLISQERIKQLNQSNNLEEDSNDSARNSEERAAEDYTKNETPKPEQVRGTTPPTTIQTKITNPEPTIGKETGGAKQVSGLLLPRRASARRDGGEKQARPAENALVSAFVKEFSPILGDGNTRSSETYLLRLAEQYGLSHSGDALDCLVRAYAEAMRTPAKHHDPATGQELKICLFNYLFKTFAESRSRGKWTYTQEKLVEDIASNERLRLFIEEYQEKMLASQATRGPLQEEADAPSVVEGSMVEQQGESEEVPLASFAFEDLRIPAPGAWMCQLEEAEALVQHVEKQMPTLQGLRVLYTLIHYCRSLRGGRVFVVEVKFEAEHRGRLFPMQEYYADTGQWEHYYEDQRKYNEAVCID